jgi:hypothetical protein
MQAFGTTEDDELQYNKQNMKNPNKNVYIAQYNNTTVGMITAVIENKEDFICDLIFSTQGFLPPTYFTDKNKSIYSTPFSTITSSKAILETRVTGACKISHHQYQ